MANAREHQSITDVVNGCGFVAEKNISTPLVQQFVGNSVRRWKAKHEAAMNKKIGKVKFTRKKRLKDMAITFSENREIPLDILAREWIDNNPVTLDVRVYLIERLFPSLIMGLEKLLTEVEKRDLVGSESQSPCFNPVNYLAQYLMRNNPKYSNFPEASPYAKGLRKAAEDLKSDIFEMDTNRLAKLKADAHKKRLEREKMEQMKGDEQQKRGVALEDLFIKWAQSEGTIPLTVVQNALCSFLEYVESLPEDIKGDQFDNIKVPKVDNTGIPLTVHEFKKFVGEYTMDMSSDAFDKFMEHLTKCAYEFQKAAERVTIRYTLKALFLACDHDGIGVLDRKRVLGILGKYYDSFTENMRKILRNPRRWPIVDVEEWQEDAIEEEPMTEDKMLARKQELSAEKSESRDGMSEAEETNVNYEQKYGNKENDIAEMTSADEIRENFEDETDELSFSNPPSPVTEVEDRLQSATTGSAFDENVLNQTQFVYLCETFLGDEPRRSVLESLVRFVKVSYSETDEERVKRQEKARLEARMKKRKEMVEQLFDFWDVDRSGVLNFQDVNEVLSQWKDISAEPQFLEFMEKSKDDKKELTCIELHDYIDSICNVCFSDEDPFEAVVIFLHTSIERTFEERKRGEARKTWLDMIGYAAKTSGGDLDPVYKATFDALYNDAEAHGHEKVVSSSISLLESNIDPENLHRGDTVLRYVAATPNDIPFVLNKVLYRDSKAVSFASVDSGRPIHVTKVNNHPGVYLWNPETKEMGASGSLIVLPLKDHEKRVTGLLTVDTLADPEEKSIFVAHEISYYQGVAKVLGQAMSFVDIRSKTVRIADSAISWIHRRSQSVKNINFYLVEPGLNPSDGLVLRKMFTFDSNHKRETYAPPLRMNRKDNLFRDYLFKCAESSETITADAYGERHVAIPIRDAEGVAIGIVDISIGSIKELPAHEMKEIQKVLRLLAVAHREVAGEIAGHGKNIVLEVEKDNEEFRIEIMFDRLMLTDLRENVSRLDNRAFAEIKSYKDPPKLVHNILKTVLGIFYAQDVEKFESWPTCKAFINADLVKMITQYDPTAPSSVMAHGKKLSESLEGISHGTVAKQASLPAQFLFNWAIVCLSLIEHTAKMNLAQPIKPVEESGTPTSQKIHSAKSKLIEVDGEVSSES